MPEHSIVVSIAWQFSMMEAMASNHEFIQIEHMFQGVTKIQDIADSEMPFLSPAQNARYLNEMRTLLHLFEQIGLDARLARRMLRTMIGDGGYTRSRPDVFHRDLPLKEAFQRAENIAESRGEEVVGVHRVLLALLENTTTLIPRLMRNVDVNIAEMMTQLDMLVIADMVSDSEANEAANQSTSSEQADSEANAPTSEKRQDNGDLSADQQRSSPKTKQSVLERFGRDLTAMAREGKLGDVFERDAELRDIILVLSRADKNNPVLTGEAGVGKTAIVEGLAYRIVNGMVPTHLRDRRIIEISATSLVSGTEYRGMFEQRMTQIIEEATSSGNIILFMDEIHTLVGIGGSNLDAANILKPALARGGFALIGATTTAEYNRFIDKDRALERRFSPINIPEPSQEATMRILNKRLGKLHAHHQNTVRVMPEAVEAAVRLGATYMPERRFPDKAFELLDDACALARVGSDLDFRNEQMRGDAPVDVTAAHVREIIDRRGGTGPIDAYETRLRKLPEYLRAHVIGQNEAIDELVRAMQSSHLGFKAKGTPVGVYMFVGPTGVGKTQLVKAIAEALYEDENSFIRIDMSEYLERHTIARLIGSPPGYVGYEDSGQLTGRLRTTPSAVVLLDEIEKAHPDVCNIFLQVFSDGRLTDSHGRTIDASRALFIMTSNLGFEHAGGDDMPLPSREEVERSVEWHFKPEFIGRIHKIVHFKPLLREYIPDIVDVHFNNVRRRVHQQQSITLELTDEAREWLADKGHDFRRGARSVVRLIERHITQPLSSMLFYGTVRPGTTLLIQVSENGEELEITTGEHTTL